MCLFKKLLKEVIKMKWFFSNKKENKQKQKENLSVKIWKQFSITHSFCQFLKNHFNNSSFNPYSISLSLSHNEWIITSVLMLWWCVVEWTWLWLELKIEMRQIKNKKHSCISHQMKVMNMGLQPNKKLIKD